MIRKLNLLAGILKQAKQSVIANGNVEFFITHGKELLILFYIYIFKIVSNEFLNKYFNLWNFLQSLHGSL